jgi:hypothetical protein
MNLTEVRLSRMVGVLKELKNCLFREELHQLS